MRGLVEVFDRKKYSGMGFTLHHTVENTLVPLEIQAETHERSLINKINSKAESVCIHSMQPII